MKEYLADNDMTPDDFELKFMMDTRARFRQTTALDALARHLNIEPTSDDYDRYFLEMEASESQERVSAIRKVSYRTELRESVKRFMASEYLLSHAQVESDAA